MPMADRLPQQGTPLCDLPADSASVLGLGSGDLCIPYRRSHDGSWGYLWVDGSAFSSHGGIPRLPTLYGGYIHPGSAAPSHLTMIISRWNGTAGARPYTVTQWTGLAA
ncbi:hypothetical protein [Nocardia rhamnosiphila]|uniref:hypothetical protein n=1 Tax=Nocardia rhamnosiphila TaxID=426716 RepID=UPI0012DE412C|nr:hypothetical protein [Nocardia rhamnosiphila]